MTTEAPAHTVPQGGIPPEDCFAFIRERYLIRQRRDAGQPKPWTEDTILQQYRFCEAYRELDAVTVWIRENWRDPHADDPDLWFAMVVARLLNNPGTLAELGYPVPWDPAHFVHVCAQRKARKERVFNPAYIVSTNGIKMDKVAFLVERVLTPLWERRETLRPKPGDSLTSYHILLGQFYGLGSFLAAQVIADVKFTGPLKAATDWYDFASSGPGSRRGLNRVLGRPVDAPWREDAWRMALRRYRESLLPLYAAAGMPVPCAQDIQNIGLCELDKYYRAKAGGRPKQLYPGAR